MSKEWFPPGSRSSSLLPCLQHAQSVFPLLHHRVQSLHRPLHLETRVWLYEGILLQCPVMFNGRKFGVCTFFRRSGLGICMHCRFDSCSTVSNMFFSFRSTYLKQQMMFHYFNERGPVYAHSLEGIKAFSVVHSVTLSFPTIVCVGLHYFLPSDVLLSMEHLVSMQHTKTLQ